MMRRILYMLLAMMLLSMFLEADKMRNCPEMETLEDAGMNSTVDFDLITNSSFILF